MGLISRVSSRTYRNSRHIMPIQENNHFDQFIGHHENFPKPGITFHDMMPLLANPTAFTDLIDTLADKFKDSGFNAIVSLESRGFLLGTPLAIKLGIPFVPIRKPGKLPGECFSYKYDLEYGSDTLEMQKSAPVNEKSKVLVVDDLLATGGTLNASCTLLNRTGITDIEMVLLIELPELNGRAKVEKYGKVHTILEY